MKNNVKKLLALFLAMLLVFSFSACVEKTDNSTDTDAKETQSSATDSAADTEKIAAEGVWKDALYRSDKSFGSGAKTIEVEVKADDKSVTFTVKHLPCSSFLSIPDIFIEYCFISPSSRVQ